MLATKECLQNYRSRQKSIVVMVSGFKFGFPVTIGELGNNRVCKGVGELNPFLHKVILAIVSDQCHKL